MQMPGGQCSTQRELIRKAIRLQQERALALPADMQIEMRKGAPEVPAPLLWTTSLGAGESAKDPQRAISHVSWDERDRSWEDKERETREKSGKSAADSSNDRASDANPNENHQEEAADHQPENALQPHVSGIKGLVGQRLKRSLSPRIQLKACRLMRSHGLPPLSVGVLRLFFHKSSLVTSARYNPGEFGSAFAT